MYLFYLNFYLSFKLIFISFIHQLNQKIYKKKEKMKLIIQKKVLFFLFFNI
jgi:hypothetical protein